MVCFFFIVVLMEVKLLFVSNILEDFLVIFVFFLFMVMLMLVCFKVGVLFILFFVMVIM